MIAPLPLLLSEAHKVQEEGVISVLVRRDAVFEALVLVVGRIEPAGPCLVGEGRIGDSEVEGLEATLSWFLKYGAASVLPRHSSAVG